MVCAVCLRVHPLPSLTSTGHTLRACAYSRTRVCLLTQLNPRPRACVQRDTPGAHDCIACLVADREGRHRTHSRQHGESVCVCVYVCVWHCCVGVWASQPRRAKGCRERGPPVMTQPISALDAPARVAHQPNPLSQGPCLTSTVVVPAAAGHKQRVAAACVRWWVRCQSQHCLPPPEAALHVCRQAWRGACRAVCRCGVRVGVRVVRAFMLCVQRRWHERTRAWCYIACAWNMRVWLVYKSPCVPACTHTPPRRASLAHRGTANAEPPHQHPPIQHCPIYIQPRLRWCSTLNSCREFKRRCHSSHSPCSYGGSA
jgi:hypothetical protein